MAVQSVKKKRSGPLARLAVKVGAVAAALFILLRFVFGVCIYRGNRMFPAVRDGDLIIYSRLPELRQGDIAAYLSPKSNKTDFSRVIGLAGCEIDITEQGELKTNGYVPQESIFYRTEKAEGSSVEFPLTVAEGRYFLLDDYRTEGRDSRVFGAVEKDRIKGKVIYIVRRRGF